MGAGNSDFPVAHFDAANQVLHIVLAKGRDRREPVTAFTLKGYKYRALIINQYPWNKTLHELTAPGVTKFRSCLLKHYPRSMAHL